jgi:hypothetical protein
MTPCWLDPVRQDALGLLRTLEWAKSGTGCR